MNIGMLYNIFVCLVTALISFGVFFQLRRMRKEKEPGYSQALEYFVFALGALWFFVGMRTFFAWKGSFEMDELIFQWISGPLTYLHLVPLFFYFGWSFFEGKKKFRSAFSILFSMVVLYTVYMFFKYGFEYGEVTYWGTDPTPDPRTNRVFMIFLFFPAFVFIIIDAIRRFVKWRKTKDVYERQLFGFTIGFLIYAVSGVIDALGGAEGLFILVSRIGTMLSPLTFYIFASLRDKK